jgi:hypothetical protein
MVSAGECVSAFDEAGRATPSSVDQPPAVLIRRETVGIREFAARDEPLYRAPLDASRVGNLSQPSSH